jgi:hypothetical protein
MDDEEITSTKVFVRQWGKTSSEKVDWDILANEEHANVGMSDITNYDPILEIPFDTDTTLDKIFFERLMPYIRHFGRLHP